MPGEKVFTIGYSANSETTKCEARTGSVNGQQITLIDTPGFFDTDRPEEEMKPEIVRCITECSPGPHAFLIVLKVERYTEQENDVIKKICESYSEEVFKHGTVVFTHGDQLPEGQGIKDFVSHNKCLNDFVKKCGGRCHVVDNKYWDQNPTCDYRSNRFQVEELLKTIDKMVQTNKGGCYTNEMLQAVEKEIQKVQENIIKTSGNMSAEESRKQAKDKFRQFMIRAAGFTTGALVGALFGVIGLGVVVCSILKSDKLQKALHLTTGIKLGALAEAGAAATGVEAVAAAGVDAVAAAGVKATVASGIESAAAAGTATTGTTAIVGTVVAVAAVAGGCKGYAEAEGAETVMDASKKAAAAVTDGALNIIKSTTDVCDKISKLL